MSGKILEKLEYANSLKIDYDNLPSEKNAGLLQMIIALGIMNQQFKDRIPDVVLYELKTSELVEIIEDLTKATKSLKEELNFLTDRFNVLDFKHNGALKLLEEILDSKHDGELKLLKGKKVSFNNSFTMTGTKRKNETLL